MNLKQIADNLRRTSANLQQLGAEAKRGGVRDEAEFFAQLRDDVAEVEKKLRDRYDLSWQIDNS